MNWTLYDVAYTCETPKTTLTVGSTPVYALSKKEAAKKARKELKLEGATKIRVTRVTAADYHVWHGDTAFMLHAVC